MTSYYPVKDPAIKRFCTTCGAQMAIVPFISSCYDPNTGERVAGTYYVCSNTRCFFGCEADGGHQYTYSFFGTLRPCRRCGYRGSYIL